MIVYTAPSSTTTVVIGLTLANTTSSQITVDAKMSAGSNTVFLINNLPIPTGSSFEFMSGNKIILEAGDAIIVSSDTAQSLDTVMSIMEIT
jgi:hypothetical protein